MKRGTAPPHPLPISTPHHIHPDRQTDTLSLCHPVFSPLPSIHPFVHPFSRPGSYHTFFYSLYHRLSVCLIVCLCVVLMLSVFTRAPYVRVVSVGGGVSPFFAGRPGPVRRPYTALRGTLTSSMRRDSWDVQMEG